MPQKYVIDRGWERGGGVKSDIAFVSRVKSKQILGKGDPSCHPDARRDLFGGLFQPHLLVVSQIPPNVGMTNKKLGI
jgi:predicted Rossmann fold nucleotide-binding protein DprA/Smf involved in DNA uptake